MELLKRLYLTYMVLLQICVVAVVIALLNLPGAHREHAVNVLYIASGTILHALLIVTILRVALNALSRRCVSYTAKGEFNPYHGSSNPKGYTVRFQEEIADHGPLPEGGVYHEFSLTYFDRSGDPVVDILLGIDEHGDPRILTSADGNYEEHKIAVYPMLPQEKAVDYDYA